MWTKGSSVVWTWNYFSIPKVCPILFVCDLKGALKWKSCQKIAINQQLMEHNDCNVHYNCVKLRIICCLLCFMITGCAFKEMGEGGRSITLDLKCEPSCLYVFGFSSSWELVGNLLTWIGVLDCWRMKHCRQILRRGARTWKG